MEKLRAVWRATENMNSFMVIVVVSPVSRVPVSAINEPTTNARFIRAQLACSNHQKESWSAPWSAIFQAAL
jgi:hypothetical protein